MMLRRIQIRLQMFNAANAIVIFSAKQSLLWTCIFTGYVTLVHFWDNPIVGAVIAVMFVDCFVSYSVIYEKAFSIPDSVEKVKATLLLSLRTRQGHSDKERQLLRRRVASVRCLGISVGGFHYLERTSTPAFVDFVVQNIVGALISFR